MANAGNDIATRIVGDLDSTVPFVTPAHRAGNGSSNINHSRAHACSRYVFKDEVLDEQYLVWLQRVILIRSGRLSLLILAVDKGVGPPLRPFHVPKDAVHHLRIEIGFWMMGGKVVVGPYLCIRSEERRGGKEGGVQVKCW